MTGAVLGDIVRPTGGTGHLNRHWLVSLVIVVVNPDFPPSRALMHYQQGFQQFLTWHRAAFVA
jgi:hypothetical protein